MQEHNCQETKYFTVCSMVDEHGASYRDAWFYCPGCKYNHPYRLDLAQPNGAIWEFNGNWDKPTFSPSLLMLNPNKPCHLFVTDGVIRYCGDCGHEYAGKNVKLIPMKDIEDLSWIERLNVKAEVIG